MPDSDVPAEVDNLEADFSFEDTQQEQGPQEVAVEGMGKAVAELIDFGYIDHYRKKNAARQRNADDGEAEITPDQMAEIFRDRFISPDFSGLDGDGVRSMQPLLPARLLESLMGEGVDVTSNADGSVSVAEADEAAGN
jgi:hypothetical protein